MPIVNYKKIAMNLKKKTLDNPAISQKNKDALNRFLDAYDVSPARETIFLQLIQKLLAKADDIEVDIKDRGKINRLFKELQKEMSPATFETLKNVSQRFARWLNNGVKPEGFIDIRSVKANQRRNLEPKDMVTWEDGLELCKHTSSLQLKAALLTQLDCGFRPSEFIDLDYGDVEVKDDMVLFSVKGKTGQRIVWMHRAAPYFLRWYDNHPSKKRDAPLWILENVKLSHRKNGETTKLSRYSYPTLQKRFYLLKAKAGLEKPMDFYNLRHSSCVLDKIDNVPVELASERHGHSVKFFTDVYGRLSFEDTLARVRNHYGEPEERKQLVKNQVCGRCRAINEPEAEYCQVCGVPLSVEQAAKVFNERNKMAEETKTNRRLMEIIINGNPKLKKSYEEVIKAEAKT